MFAAAAWTLLPVGGDVNAQGLDRQETERCIVSAGPVRFDIQGWKTDFCRASVPLQEIRSGGPPRDGIPPIDVPRFESVADADSWLGPRQPVLLLEVGGIARIYPLAILTWHEIVNDEISGRPVAVTFCPLCNAALVFVRPAVDGKTLSFGTSGNLRHSDLVMWDRETESWWQQWTGEAIVGRLTGQVLENLASSIVSWEAARSAHPSAEVLSRDSGFSRPYGRNPYVGYDDIEESPFLFEGRVESGLPAMARVVGVTVDGQSVVIPFEVLADRQVVNDTLAGRAIVFLHMPGAASALDAERIEDGRDVGSVAVFDRIVEDQLLTFVASLGEVTDRETGSRWDMMGRAVEGKLSGRRLRRVVHHETFWFAWAAFKPEARRYGFQ